MRDDDGKIQGTERTLHGRREETLRAFGTAWENADLERLMDLMTDDCIYQASVGPEPGCTYVGRAAVRAGFEAMLARDSGSESRSGRFFVAGAAWGCERGSTYRAGGRSRDEELGGGNPPVVGGENNPQKIVIH